MIDRIVELMEKKNVTAKKLVTDLGLSSSAVTEWKKRKALPGTDAVIKLSDYFNVTTDYILKGTPSTGAPQQEVHMQVAERILELMQERNVKAAQLTREIPLTNGLITQWKKGLQKPSTDAVVKIANYFGVTTDYLLQGTPSTGAPQQKETYQMDAKPLYYNIEDVCRVLKKCIDPLFHASSYNNGTIIEISYVDLHEKNAPKFLRSAVEISENRLKEFGLLLNRLLDNNENFIESRFECADIMSYYPSPDELKLIAIHTLNYYGETEVFCDKLCKLEKESNKTQLKIAKSKESPANPTEATA